MYYERGMPLQSMSQDTWQPSLDLFHCYLNVFVLYGITMHFHCNYILKSIKSRKNQLIYVALAALPALCIKQNSDEYVLLFMWRRTVQTEVQWKKKLKSALSEVCSPSHMHFLMVREKTKPQRSCTQGMCFWQQEIIIMIY